MTYTCNTYILIRVSIDVHGLNYKEEEQILEIPETEAEGSIDTAKNIQETIFRQIIFKQKDSKKIFKNNIQKKYSKKIFKKNIEEIS